MRVLHLPERVGRGEARNLALDTVTGEYVWCVETTDRWRPGALTDIAARLADVPDVLLVQHARRQPPAAPRRGAHRKLLARAAARGPGPLERHPGSPPRRRAPGTSCSAASTCASSACASAPAAARS